MAAQPCEVFSLVYGYAPLVECFSPIQKLVINMAMDLSTDMHPNMDLFFGATDITQPMKYIVFQNWDVIQSTDYINNHGWWNTRRFVTFLYLITIPR